jgi:hypothetical protein
MLFSPVYIESHPRRSTTFVSRMNLRNAAFASRPDVWALDGNRGRFPVPEMDLRDASTQPFRSLAPYGWQNPSSNLFGINTCKSVSKQSTLTPFRMNTYEKHRGEGVLLLTRNPKKDFYPEGAPRLKDLCSPPTTDACPASPRLPVGLIGSHSNSSYSDRESPAGRRRFQPSPELQTPILPESFDPAGRDSCLSPVTSHQSPGFSPPYPCAENATVTECFLM